MWNLIIKENVRIMFYLVLDEMKVIAYYSHCKYDKCILIYYVEDVRI